MSPILACITTVTRLAWLCCVGIIISGTVHATTTNPSVQQCNNKDLVFVAHLDDDLLFMNPDIAANINDGGCVLTVYLTASDRGRGEDYMRGRERGVRAAYAYLANVPDLWTEDTAAVGAYHLARFTLTGNSKIQLLAMRLKDPWLGKGWGSLTPLSRAESIAGYTADTLGASHETYGRADLVATLASLIEGYRPTTIRHMDDTIDIPYTKLCWRCAGHGHPDHIASARLVRDAIKIAHGNYAEVGYIGYPTQERQANLDKQEINRKTEVFRRYAWNDIHYCSGPLNCKEPAGPAASWVGRAYYVSRGNTPPSLFADRKGGMLILATGEDNDAANVWNSRAQDWRSLGGRTADPLASFTYPDTTLGFFVRDAIGGIWVNKQNLDETWRGWRSIPGARCSRIPTATAQGRTAAVALANDGLLYWTAPTGTENNWAPWRPLPPLHQPTGDLAITTDAANRLVIFAATTTGKLFFVQQTNDEDTGLWSAWTEIHVPPTDGGLSAIRDPRGPIVVYLRNRTNNHLLRMTQARNTHDVAGHPSAALWNEAADLGIEFVGKPAVDLNEHGAIIAAALERQGGALWLFEDAHAQKIAANISSSPALRVINGALYIVARNAGKPQIYQILERRQNIWTSTLSVGAPPQGGGSSFAPLAAAVPRIAVAGRDPALK